MTRIDYPRIGERAYRRTLSNGLTVFVFPKPDYGKSYAFFAANYGGIDMRFRAGDTWRDTPAGVAHYLEHKLFDTQDGNALQELASNGASPNAFTSSAITGYFFESTEKFEDNLKTLLSFVSVPYFTQESVDKERGIISQEIRMIEDEADWRVFMDLLGALYAAHPIRVGVAGTVESIQDITPEILYDCHRAFYTPANMVLCVAGNVDAERVCAIAEEVLPAEVGKPVARDYGAQEPPCAIQKLTERRMAVSTPIFQFGCKGDAAATGSETLRIQLLGELAMEALAGRSSPLYAELYEQGLINSEFSCGCETYPGCAFLYAGGESRDPHAVADRLKEEARRLAREGIEPALWSRIKKAAYGSRVRALNSFENICVSQAQACFFGVDAMTFPEVFDALTAQDAQELLGRWVTEERTALSIVRPEEGRS